MPTVLNPYLSFHGEAREAMEFYQSVFGGELVVSTFAENGMSVDADETDNVMHSMLTSPSALVLMGADVPHSMPGDYPNGSISLSGDDEAELTGYWTGLATGATISQPLEKAPWGDTFGMLVDRFGVSWLMNITGSPA